MNPSTARRALSSVAHIVLGRKIARLTGGVVYNPWAVLEIAERTLVEDGKHADPNSPEYTTILRAVSRKLDAIEEMRTLATAIDALDPQGALSQ